MMKVYIERNNLKLEVILCRYMFHFIHVYFCEATDSMQCCPLQQLRMHKQ